VLQRRRAINNTKIKNEIYMPKDPALPILMYKKLQKYTHKLCQEIES